MACSSRGGSEKEAGPLHFFRKERRRDLIMATVTICNGLDVDFDEHGVFLDGHDDNSIQLNIEEAKRLRDALIENLSMLG